MTNDFFLNAGASETVLIPKRHASSTAIDSPADPSVILVADIFEIKGHFRPLTETH
jgi:dienelactone hydrolase